MFNFLRSFSQPKQIPTSTNQQIVPPTKQNYYSTTPKLRDNFAEELLNLEMDVESDDVQMETITQLLNLYKEAVEYFEAIQSKKYLIFKNKIQALFCKRNVMKAMKVDQKKNEKTDIKQQINSINQTDQKQKADTIITEHKKQQQQLNSFIQENLQAQNNVIQARLEKRKNSQVRQNIEIQKPSLETQEQSSEFNICHTPQIKTQVRQYRGRQNIDL